MRKDEKSERNNSIVLMYENGKKTVEIARYFSISRQRVHQVLRGYKTAPNRVRIMMANNRCDICGSADKLVVHHKDKNSRNNNRDNLMKICSNCHVEIHKNLRSTLETTEIGRHNLARAVSRIGIKNKTYLSRYFGISKYRLNKLLIDYGIIDRGDKDA